MGHHDESLIDKVKNALGMGDDGRDQDTEGATATTTRTDGGDERAEGWAGVPEALYDDRTAYETDDVVGNQENAGPIGSARYEDGAPPEQLGASDYDAGGGIDTTRDDAAATEYGGAYGEDETPMPTSAAPDRGEAPVGEASFDTEEDALEPGRRETGI